MARIQQYSTDTTITGGDKLVGNDASSNLTKLFQISDIAAFFAKEGIADGAKIGYQFNYGGKYNSNAIASGNIEYDVNPTAPAQFTWANIDKIAISTNSANSADISNVLPFMVNQNIKVTDILNDTVDNFAVFNVSAIADITGGKLLTVSLKASSGTPTAANIVLAPFGFVSASDINALTPDDIIQADWAESNTASDAFIQNKPTDLTTLNTHNVTELSDVTSAGSGEIITSAERQSLNNFTANGLVHADIVNNVVSTAIDVPLSAAQGKVLKDLIDAINTLLTSDNVNLDSLQEVVDFIEANKDTLDNLSISNIAGLQAALDAKQNTEVGKGLSTEDFTTTLLNKLNGIAAGAQVNVKPNWTAGAGTDAEILNKPSDLTDLTLHSVTELNDVTSAGSGGIITSAERTKLTGIEDSADVTDTANVTAAGALMDSEVTNLAQVKAFDAADYATAAQGTKADSAQQPPVEGPFVDGDKTKLDGIESNADVTDTANVTAAGALMDSELTNEAAVKAIDQGLATTDDVDFNSIQVDDTIELITSQSTTPTFDNGIYYSTEDGHDTLHFRYHGHDLSIDYLTENIPTGILNGGVLSTNTSTTFDVAAGDGVINILNKDNSDPHPEIKKIIWSATTVTHTLGNAGDANQLNTWVYVDSSGNIQQTLTTPSPALWRSNIVLGSVIHSSNVIRFVKTFPRPSYSNGNTFAEFVEIFGPLKKSGHLLTVNSTNTLALDRAAGISFGVGRNYQVDAEEPNLVSDGASTPVFHRYSSTATGFTKDDGTAGAGYTAIDPSKYDNNGTLTTVSAGQYTAQRLFHFPNNTNVIVSYYGKAEYASIDEAEKNYLLENFQEADNTSAQAIYLGALIVKGNATDLGNSSQAKILTGGIFRSLSATNLGGVAIDSEINELIDVNITGVTNNQILQYNGSTGEWENSTDLDLGGNKALFGNVYATEGDLPSASTYHGMFAHVHGTGKGYFAHAGNWVKLLDETSSTTDNLTEGSTNLYYPSADATKVGHISVTQAVDLDTIESDTAANNAKVTFPGFGTTAGTALEGDTQFVNGTGSANKIAFWTDADTLSNDTNLHWNTSSDRLGIGTTSPSNPLHVYNATVDTVAKFESGDASVAVSLEASDNTAVLTTSGTDFLVKNDGSGNLRFFNNNSERMRVDSNGNVGIGTTSPSVSLDINDTDAIKIPNGTTGERPTAAAGMLRYNTTDGQFEGYTTEWGPIGGGGGSSTIYRESFSGDGSTTTFTLSESVSDEANTQVYVNGVYQSKLNYSTSGTSLVFSTAPIVGTNNIEVIHIASVSVTDVSGLNKNTFTGDGSTVAFTLSAEPSTEDFTFVFMQGVYQEKSTYSISGTTLTFATAPQNGNSIEVMHLGAVNVQQTNYLAYDTFTGDGNTASYTLVNGAPSAKEFTMIFLDGVYQAKANYSLTSGAIVFNTAPSNSVVIEIASINGGGINIATVQPDIDANDAKYNVSVISADTTAVSGYVYVLTGALTLTLPALPNSGDSIKISNRSGVGTCVLGRNGNNIMGSASDLTLDTASASFELIYSDATNGWVIIGQ